MGRGGSSPAGASREPHEVEGLLLALAHGLDRETLAERGLEKPVEIEPGVEMQEDTAKADGKKYPQHQASQMYHGCALFQGKAGDAAGPCSLFGGKTVSGKGWCSAWAKKA